MLIHQGTSPRRIPRQIIKVSSSCCNSKSEGWLPSFAHFLELAPSAALSRLELPPLQLLPLPRPQTRQRSTDEDAPLARDHQGPSPPPPPQTPTQKCPPTPPPLAQHQLPPGRRRTPPQPSTWERSKSPPRLPPPPTPLPDMYPANGRRNLFSRSQARSCLGCRRRSSRARGCGRQPPNSAKRPRGARSSSPRRGRARLGSRRGWRGWRWWEGVGRGLRWRARGV